MENVPQSRVHLGLCGCPSGLSSSVVGTDSDGFMSPTASIIPGLWFKPSAFLMCTWDLMSPKAVGVFSVFHVCVLRVFVSCTVLLV